MILIHLFINIFIGDQMIERLHLEIIYMLDKEGSLTRAADRLALTQPALTHSIKKLENRIGCKIWSKKGRSIEFTTYGLFLLKRAKKILPQFHEMEMSLGALVSGKKGNLRICVECHPCYELIIGVLEGFLKSWKDVDINVVKNFQFNGIEAILNQSVDLIISSDKYDHPSLVYYPIADFKFLLAVNSEHEFANRKYIVPADLHNQTILTFPVDINRLDIFTGFLFPHKITPRKHLTIEATEIMLQLVSAGRGISYFPDWLIDKYSDIYNIKGIKMGKAGIKKTLYIGIRKEDNNIEYLRDFILRATKVLD